MCNRCEISNEMTSAAGNETLDRIQKEIQESLQKEEEWKRAVERGATETNNIVPKIPKEPPKSNTTSQNVHLFIQNLKTKGVMQRFLKSKGKVSPRSQPLTNGNVPVVVPELITDFAYQPPRVTSETGTLSRNGFVPADVKIRNELQEFQKRETELRKERRKSQPQLMALLKLEDEDEGFPELSSPSSSCSPELKSARSLADLCNTPEEKLDAPGTHNLIKQFESLKKI